MNSQIVTELSRASLFQTLDKEEYNDRESDSLSHSKVSIDPKVPVKKISISNVDTMSNLSSPKMPAPKTDPLTKSISLVSGKSPNSLTVEVPKNLRKSTTSAMNTVSVKKCIENIFLTLHLDYTQPACNASI